MAQGNDGPVCPDCGKEDCPNTVLMRALSGGQLAGISEEAERLLGICVNSFANALHDHKVPPDIGRSIMKAARDRFLAAASEAGHLVALVVVKHDDDGSHLNLGDPPCDPRLQ